MEDTMAQAKQERVARRYVVRGQVQGVGFRFFTVRMAETIGVSGWVRNLDDGGVEAVACGTKRQIDEFSGYLRRGPRWSEVRSVEETEHPLLQSGGFSIRY
jgi:acylphosphatase